MKDIGQGLRLQEFQILCRAPSDLSIQRSVCQSLKDSEFDRLAVSSLTPQYVKSMLLLIWSSRQRVKKWSKIQKQILVFLVLRVCGTRGLSPLALADQDWQEISKFLLWSADQCRRRWMSAVRSRDLSDWAKEQDALLQEIVQEHRPIKWSRIADSFNDRSPRKLQIFRSSKNCRERWSNHLDLGVIKGEWTLKEDCQLVTLIQELGKKWNLISKKLSRARTQNTVKNRYNALLRQARKFRKDLSEEMAFALVSSQIKLNYSRTKCNQSAQKNALSDFSQQFWKKEAQERESEERPVSSQYTVRQERPPSYDPGWRMALVNRREQLMYYVPRDDVVNSEGEVNQSDSTHTKEESAEAAGADDFQSERSETLLQAPAPLNYLLFLGSSQERVVIDLARATVQTASALLHPC